MWLDIFYCSKRHDKPQLFVAQLIYRHDFLVSPIILLLLLLLLSACNSGLQQMTATWLYLCIQYLLTLFFLLYNWQRRFALNGVYWFEWERRKKDDNALLEKMYNVFPYLSQICFMQCLLYTHTYSFSNGTKAFIYAATHKIQFHPLFMHEHDLKRSFFAKHRECIQIYFHIFQFIKGKIFTSRASLLLLL